MNDGLLFQIPHVEPSEIEVLRGEYDDAKKRLDALARVGTSQEQHDAKATLRRAENALAEAESNELAKRR